MTSAQHACNYALLHFRPHRETGEMVNVGVVGICLQPCLFHFMIEEKMTARLKAVFPEQKEEAFAAAAAAMKREMERVKATIHDPKTCQLAFNKVVRPRESIFCFSEPRTILTADALHFAEVLFSRYVRMEALPQHNAHLAAA
ncbi:DUF3037 domain-containing protein [Prosthecobacter sp.]|uniref:DUF3037 domain-containing protein n=1 Tax=Prosthecobacter sp. TaxID=1965333 RepID=UPI0037830B9D